MSKALLENEARVVLEEYGIKCVPGMFCTSKEELFEAAGKIGYPVVIKVVSPDVIHKSDSGGVKLNITDKEMLEKAYDEMIISVTSHVPNADIHGVLVTRFVRKARELIIGSVNDAQFGPVVMVGLGGIFVEVFKDISFGIAPVTLGEAHKMLESLKSFPLIKGIRGEAPANIDAICEMIMNVSHFVYKNGVAELDLNPVFCVENEVFAGDARILLK